MERAGAAMLGGDHRRPGDLRGVGVPGMLQSLIAEAPPHSRIVVVGVCMQSDSIEPFMAVTKEIEFRFSFGYTGAEFAATLERLGAGVPGADRLVTSWSTGPARPAPSRPCARPVSTARSWCTP